MTEKAKAQETISILTLSVLVFLGFIKGKWLIAFYMVTFFICIGLFVPPLAIIIHRTWMPIAKTLGTINTKILLTFVFIFFLTPLACLRRFFASDPLNTKPPKETLLIPREHLYTREDLENPY